MEDDLKKFKMEDEKIIQNGRRKKNQNQSNSV